MKTDIYNRLCKLTRLEKEAEVKAEMTFFSVKHKKVEILQA